MNSDVLPANKEDPSSVLSSTSAKSPPGTLRLDWVMLDCYLQRMSSGDPDDAATEDTSNGDSISVALLAIAPPGISHLLFDWHPRTIRDSIEEGGEGLIIFDSWCFAAPNVVAAHGNSVLLRFVLPAPLGTRARTRTPTGRGKGMIRHPRSVHDEFFVFQPRSNILTRLPTCDFFVNYSARDNMGFLCREDHQFVVASLSVIPKEWWKTQQSTISPTADLSLLYHGDTPVINNLQLPIHHLEGKGKELFLWDTDASISFGDSICWVDYLRGILFCDNVFNHLPELHYVSLPVDPYRGRRNPMLGGRGPLSAYRSLCVTKDTSGAAMIKFIDVASSNLWFSEHIYTPLTITSWTLSSDRLKWNKDNTMGADEFFKLTSSHLQLPSSFRPQFPLVDIRDPQTIYFDLRDNTSMSPPTSDGKSFFIALNMPRKTLDLRAEYKLTSSLSSGQRNTDKDKTSCNLFYYQPFIPLEFSNCL